MATLLLTILSQITGWIYFLAWSLSFYPQIIIFYRTKLAHGYNLDYALYNIVGFVCYSVYTCVGYFVPGRAIGVFDLSDVVFALHGVMCTFIIIVQLIMYDTGGQRMRKFAIGLVSILLLLAVLFFCLQETGNMATNRDWNDLLWLGYVKCILTVVKYTPQVYHIWLRKSTEGWAFWGVGGDIIGGIFSLIQIVIDGANTGNWNVFGNGGTFNVAKFFLGFFSIIFDIVFFYQFWLYKGMKPVEKTSVEEYEELENRELIDCN